MYSNQFLAALATGRTVVRRIFKNENRAGQVTVQLMQEIETDDDPASMNLIAMAQGIETKQRVTALFSFSEKVIYGELQLADGDYFNQEQVLFGSVLFKNKEISIRVYENFTPNEYYKSHSPKLNPSNNKVIMFFDKPVYRHTEVVAGNRNTVQHAFVRNEADAKECLNIPNTSIALAASRIKYVEAMKEVPVEEQDNNVF